MTRAFDVPAGKYDRLIGRYLPELAPRFADATGVTSGMRVLDVGSGPGGLTGELFRRGAMTVAVEPEPGFARACHDRHPGASVHQGVAEHLPFADDTFDASLASLVVAFMTDPGAGVREMARVTRPGGVVAACMWDTEAVAMMRMFWTAAQTADPELTPASKVFGGSAGELVGLLTDAGLTDVREDVLVARAHYTGFADWWEPCAQGPGPIGAYYRSLDATAQARLHDVARVSVTDEPFTLDAQARFASGTVS